MNFLSLIWLIFLPVIAAIVIMLPVFPNHQVRIRRFAKWFAGLHFVYALLFLLFFDTSMYGMSFEKELTFFGMSWLKTLGISAKFALDGMTLLLSVLTAFISHLNMDARNRTCFSLKNCSLNIRSAGKPPL